MASRPLSEPPAPGRGVEGAGVALEVRRCVDPLAARSCSSRGASSPLRLRSRRRPPLPPRGPGDWGASGDADGGAAAAAAAPGRPPLSSPKATSLRSNDLYIPGLGLPSVTRSPGEGRAPAESRAEGGAGRRAERLAPRAPTRDLVAPSGFPGSARRAPQGPKGPQSRPGRPPSGACVSAFP